NTINMPRSRDEGGPMAARRSAASVLAAVVSMATGGASLNTRYGMTTSATTPGTDAASAQIVHVNRTDDSFATMSATSGFGAHAVRNIAETTRSPWYRASMRKAPMRDAVGPGSEPNTRATLSVIGNRIPPARAVFEAVIGAITRSASTIEYPSPSGLPPTR